MEIHYSLEVAHNVLDAINATHTIQTDNWVVHSFSNGREQGLLIAHQENRNKVAFAQQRNGDQVIVYYGNGNEFDICTHLPVDDAGWDRYKTFSGYDMNGVVEFIDKWLTDGVLE